MEYKQLRKMRERYLDRHLPYRMTYFESFDFRILRNIMYLRKTGNGGHDTYNDCIIMADTETSKKQKRGIAENHVVAWTISIRAFDRNLVTLWGRKPSDLAESLKKICDQMAGEYTYVYFHNLAYDWVFIRRFLFRALDKPEKQLNVKPHYPIFVKFGNGLILRDSLILAQRKLEKWADDLEVEHRKEVGKWDYDKLRGQKEYYSQDELDYIEHDTLAGVECLYKTMKTLNKKVYSMPYTATGIPREEIRILGQQNNAHDWFLRQALTYAQQVIMEKVYHGGYAHANRHFIEEVIGGLIRCFDFASSYPFCMLAFKFPAERFTPVPDCQMQDLIKMEEEYAYRCKLRMYKFRLKDDKTPMPVLQYSKLVKDVNCVQDNGRVLCGLYAEIWVTEQDLAVIDEQYICEKHICTEVESAAKEYLPRWLTDYIFRLFSEKCTLKGGDPVLYSLAKARLNSIYGLFVQKPVRDSIEEDYDTGEYLNAHKDLEAEYEKYVQRYTSVLPYQIGVWVTAYAFRNLHRLGKCIDYEHGGEWIYSDTDSIYATGWDMEKVNAYNEHCKELLRANGYGPVKIGAKEFWLGIAESKAKEDAYSEFVTTGAKRYCGRSLADGQIHITVAGVPKKGAECLKDDIRKFRTGFKFTGRKTGKKTHTYFYNDIYTDAAGNETGDSIDLSPCDYLLDAAEVVDWEKVFEEEIEVQVYDEE